MSVRTKGGMYCPRCNCPVAAERSGHAVRNSIGALATLGLSLKSERWHCPICGGPVEREATRKIRVPPLPPAMLAPVEGMVAVTLIHPGNKLIPVIKIYRRLTGEGLKESRHAMERVPVPLGQFLPAEAQAIVAELTNAGAMAETSSQ